MVFHLLDRDELEFPFEDPTIFQDLEEDLKLLTDPRSVRSAYLKTVNSLIEGYRESCAAHLVDYSLFNTSVGLWIGRWSVTWPGEPNSKRGPKGCEWFHAALQQEPQETLARPKKKHDGCRNKYLVKNQKWTAPGHAILQAEDYWELHSRFLLSKGKACY